MTTDIKTRIAEHRMTYKNMKIIFIISLGEYDVRTGEDTIKYCHHVRSRIIDLVMDESKKKECFACDFGDIKEVMNGIIGDVKKQHGPKIKLEYLQLLSWDTYLYTIKGNKTRIDNTEAFQYKGASLISEVFISPICSMNLSLEIKFIKIL